MDPGRTYSAAGIARMMKLQDVLLKAMAKKISRVTAAEIIGVTPRTMRRWRLSHFVCRTNLQFFLDIACW